MYRARGNETQKKKRPRQYECKVGKQGEGERELSEGKERMIETEKSNMCTDLVQIGLIRLRVGIIGEPL